MSRIPFGGLRMYVRTWLRRHLRRCHVLGDKHSKVVLKTPFRYNDLHSHSAAAINIPNVLQHIQLLLFTSHTSLKYVSSLLSTDERCVLPPIKSLAHSPTDSHIAAKCCLLLSMTGWAQTSGSLHFEQMYGAHNDTQSILVNLVAQFPWQMSQ